MPSTNGDFGRSAQHSTDHNIGLDPVCSATQQRTSHAMPSTNGDFGRSAQHTASHTVLGFLLLRPAQHKTSHVQVVTRILEVPQDTHHVLDPETILEVRTAHAITCHDSLF